MWEGLLKGVWLSILALFFSLLSASASVFLFLSLSKKLEQSDISRALDIASAEIGKIQERRVKGIETEWDDTYQKFSRLAGRMDREKRDAPVITAGKTEGSDGIPDRAYATRSEIIRSHRRSRNEQDSTA